MSLFAHAKTSWVTVRYAVKEAKNGIRRPVQFQILDFGFVPVYKKGVKGKYQLVITASKWSTFKAKLKEITRKTRPKSFDQRIYELNAYENGWIESRKYANIKAKLNEMDSLSRTFIREMVTKPITVLHLAPLEET